MLCRRAHQDDSNDAPQPIGECHFPFQWIKEYVSWFILIHCKGKLTWHSPIGCGVSFELSWWASFHGSASWLSLAYIIDWRAVCCTKKGFLLPHSLLWRRKFLSECHQTVSPHGSFRCSLAIRGWQTGRQTAEFLLGFDRLLITPSVNGQGMMMPYETKSL